MCLHGTEKHKAMRCSIGNSSAAAGVLLKMTFVPQEEAAAQQAGTCTSDVSLEI